MVVFLVLVYLISVAMYQYLVLTDLDKGWVEGEDWFSVIWGEIQDTREGALSKIFIIGYIPIVNTYLVVKNLLEN